jgi:hypothetical protein
MRRWPWLLSSALVVLAQSAHAIPSAANSHIPSHILLVGRKLDLADTSSGAFTVIVHDAANTPVANSTVEVRILNCPGARLSTQSYVPGGTIRCGTAGVLGTTDANGEVRLTVVGGGLAGAPAGAGPVRARSTPAASRSGKPRWPTWTWTAAAASGAPTWASGSPTSARVRTSAGATTPAMDCSRPTT